MTTAEALNAALSRVVSGTGITLHLKGGAQVVGTLVSVNDQVVTLTDRGIRNGVFSLKEIAGFMTYPSGDDA